ncbi:1-phosphofructokinase [Cytobacillus sp. Hz8]|uniref:1-phosphofructokinase n=1 Tax=Cytobacillus sp. Hz8 TaxID=3347168 RepID=UPI0035D89D58
MIYTVTLNPSLDYIVGLDSVKLGELNRIKKDTKFPGGKGINVSRVLKRLGVNSLASGFIGGFTGEFIKNYLIKEDIVTHFIHVKEDTRINVKIKSKIETELNASGPTIYQEDFAQLKMFISSLTNEDLLVVAGSIPSSMPKNTYEEILAICQSKDIKFVVDAEGELLKKILPFKPFLIKPNHHELGQFFQTEITRKEEVAPYCRKLLDLGAENIIVSLAGEGAIFMNRDHGYYASAPVGEVKNSIGAGDSMVAGFLAQYAKSKNVKEAFRYCVATGSATAFSMDLCTKDKVEELLPQVQITELEEETK